MNIGHGFIPFMIQKIISFVSELDSYNRIPKCMKWISPFIRKWNLYAPRDLGAKSALLTYNTFLSMVPMSAYIVLLSRSADMSADQIGQNLSMILPGVSPNTLSVTLGNGETWIQSHHSLLFIAILLSLWSVLSLILRFDEIIASIWGKEANSASSQSIMKLLSRGLAVAFCLMSIVGLWDVAVHNFIPLLIPQVQDVILWPVRFIVFLLVSFGAIYYMPLVFPKFKNAFCVSLVIALVFLAMQYVCSLFVDLLAQYNSSFGSFGSIILLVIWLRLAWMFVIVGLGYCYVKQYGSKIEESVSDTSDIIIVMAMLCTIRSSSCTDGMPIKEFCSHFSRLDEEQMKGYLSLMVKAGLIDVSFKKQVIVPTVNMNELNFFDCYNRVNHIKAQMDYSSFRGESLLVSDIEITLNCFEKDK